jgi:hypothetical protein
MTGLKKFALAYAAVMALLFVLALVFAWRSALAPTAVTAVLMLWVAAGEHPDGYYDARLRRALEADAKRKEEGS